MLSKTNRDSMNQSRLNGLQTCFDASREFYIKGRVYNKSKKSYGSYTQDTALAERQKATRQSIECNFFRNHIHITFVARKSNHSIGYCIAFCHTASVATTLLYAGAITPKDLTNHS